MFGSICTSSAVSGPAQAYTCMERDKPRLSLACRDEYSALLSRRRGTQARRRMAASKRRHRGGTVMMQRAVGTSLLALLSLLAGPALADGILAGVVKDGAGKPM